MKKNLIIGAGIGQYYLAKKIKERGDFLITVTLPGNQPVIPIADKVFYENVFNKEAVLEIAKQEGIDAVISDQNDTMMPTVAYVSEHLGLPGNDTSVVNSYCNKNVFRDNCDRLQIPVPRHCPVNDVIIPIGFNSIPFPWVVKPADSQSSVGVSKVNSLEEYEIAIRNAIELSRTHSAIVEEFFSGQEIVAEGFIYKGKYYSLGFADRKYFILENLFIPSQTLFPSVVSNSVLEKITECETKMADYVKPAFAIVHSEYLYDSSSGQFKVVESALRGGGVYISSHLIPLYSGIDINDVLLDCAVGNTVDIMSIFNRRRNRAAGYICFYLPPGEIESISGVEKCERMPFVKMLAVEDIHVGMKTHPITHKGQRMGPILLEGSNREDLDNKVMLIQDSLRIMVRDEGICKNMNWE